MNKVYSKEEILKLEKKINEVRKLIVRMLTKAGSGHPGGSLSSAELISCLYFEVLRYNPKDPKWPQRDRFHMSKGHCCPLWYVVLAQCGYFSTEELWNLRQFGSMLQGHPDRRVPGIDAASGSLGQGLSVALGMALAGKIDKNDYRVYCLLGDGEIQEGNVWEAAMAASHYNCDNICAIVDYNGYQIDGKISEIMNLDPLVDKWRAFGWHTIEIDGHSVSEILNAYNQAKTLKDKPTVIIAHTVKGKGVSFMENVVDFHGRTPTKEEEIKALEELKG